MYELIVTLCIAGDPAMCKEDRVPFHEPVNMMRCFRYGLNHAQKFADARPDMTLKQWRCATAEVLPSPAEKGPFHIEEVADGVFVHRGEHITPNPLNRGDAANLGFVIGENAVAVIDAGTTVGIAEDLIAAIRKRTDRPIKYLLLTHMHPDHVLGAPAFVEVGAAVIGHAKLGRALLARADTYRDNLRRLLGDDVFGASAVVLPEFEVDGQLTVDLGGRSLVLETHKTAHTSSDMTVFDRKTGTWFLGDLLFAGHIPALDGSITGWLSLLDELEARPVERVVPGHGPASMPWPEAARPLRRYLESVASATRKAIEDGASLSEATRTIGEEHRHDWKLFDEFNKRNVTAAYTELEWE